ncbi:hypothetical protein GMD78_11125 [Ornithinibacillus sp. L9]|uniref:Uncharacterized protein n=1 Tax=Ornithinibacillus caprae TaxID=2678566 RepID=A0A6N8FJS0_9BACI|nr:hypothetical protein [Ornithinibacillus caprae]MUK88946.1 hypothetical protein [Ornithinibacillus caprae]
MKIINRKNYIKNFMIFVSMTLGISLIVNVTLLFKINDIENQVNDIFHMQHTINGNVNNQSSNIQNVVNDFKEEQRLISRAIMEINTNDSTGGTVEGSFEWQVKELHSDSEVLFHYTYGEREDYTAIPADEIEQGLFQVTIPLEIDLVPQWEVALIRHSAHAHEEISIQEMEARKAEEQETLKYYVTVSHEDTIHSGEVQTEYLGAFGANYYGTIQTDLDMDDEDIDVHLVHHNMGDLSLIVEEAYLLMYEEDTLIGEEEIELQNKNSSDAMTRFFHLKKVEPFESMRLVIKVVYSNGETFEDEVYHYNEG